MSNTNPRPAIPSESCKDACEMNIKQLQLQIQLELTIRVRCCNSKQKVKMVHLSKHTVDSILVCWKKCWVDEDYNKLYPRFYRSLDSYCINTHNYVKRHYSNYYKLRDAFSYSYMWRRTICWIWGFLNGDMVLWTPYNRESVLLNIRSLRKIPLESSTFLVASSWIAVHTFEP